MKILLVPTYREVFDEEAPDVSSLIEGIPTRLLVILISVMNAELHLSSVEIGTQIKILNFLLQRQTSETRQKIYRKITAEFLEKGIKELSIFSVSINLEFLHFCLAHYHDDETFVDTNPEQELKIFKAYLLIAQEVFSRMKMEVNTESPIDYFRKNTWPLMIGQFQLNQPYNYFLAIVKAKCFFDALEFEAGCERYVHAFIKRFGDQNSFNYIFRYATILQQSHQKDETKNFAPFSIRSDETSLPFFNELCLNLEKYNSEFGTEKLNYNGLKDKPLFKVGQDSFVIINWNFLSRKLYDGMLFDFYNRSGINKKKGFQDFISFKKFISEESIEKYLFKRLIRACFKKKHTIVKFDDGTASGVPDAYVRLGKKILLFEIKDAFFPSKAVDSSNHDKIKEVIDQKYNSKKKGTGQLIKQIRQLKTIPFESHTYDQLGLKTRNLIIYPIVVYTDPFFSLPGVMKYLQEEFMEKISEENFGANFQNIKTLSFIDIDFLVGKLNQLQKNDSRLDKLIDLTEVEMKKRVRRFNKTNSIDNLLAMNDNFESLCSLNLDRHNSEDNYVQVIFDELELRRGLA